jgi:hypothetical protein
VKSPIFRTRKICFAIFLSYVFITSGCVTHSQRNEFVKKIETNQCETAYENVPDAGADMKLLREVQSTTGTALHYSVTGLGYTSEVVLKAVAGVAFIVVACGPTLAAFAASKGNASGAEFRCLPIVPFNMKSVPAVGRKTRTATENWKCADLTPLAESMMMVSDCFAARKTKADTDKAIANLKALQSSQDILECLPMKAEDLIIQKINSYNEGTP